MNGNLLSVWWIFAVFVGVACTVPAQDAAPPKVDLDTRGEPAATTPSPSPSPEIPDLSQIDAVFKETSLGKQADENRLHVEWRQVANQAANDPDVISAKAAIKRASTDLEKRERMRSYYSLYYGRMQALAGDPKLKSALEGVKAAHINATKQPRVRPLMDQVSPTPTVAPGSDAGAISLVSTPTPSTKHKHKKRVTNSGSLPVGASRLF